MKPDKQLHLPPSHFLETFLWEGFLGLQGCVAGRVPT